jgi:long-chain acyl-CoA synthetase
MPNRPEYYLTAFGCWSQGIPIVPLYTTLGPDAVYTILEQTQCEFLVLSKENLSTAMKAFAKLKADKKSVGVKTVFVCDALFDNLWGNVFDTIDEKLAAECKKEYDITVCPFSAAAVAGQEATELIQPSDEIKPETQAYIMFTSGTTSENGKIKGAILTHGGFASCIGASRYTIPLSTFIGQPVMSFLPLSHVFQVCIDLACLSSGANLIFGSGIIYLPTDLTEGQPICFPAVPRIAQRFYSGVFGQISKENFLKRWYINRAYAYQCNQLDNNLPLDPTYDERVFKVIRTKMGLGNLRIFLLSGAPCPPNVLQFMRVLLGPESSTLLGYGLTETHGGLSSSLPFDTLPHHIGTPIVSAEWRLKSLPDMNYSYKDENPCGELLVRGNSITPGYFQNDEENEKNFEFDSQGSRWYKTGDVVKMHKNSGLLQIIDRRKNCIKLSFGEYVGIEKLVSAYSECKLLSQVFPYGNAFKNSMVAVVVPNLIELYKFAKSKGWWNIPNSPVIGSLSPEVIAEAGRIGEEYQSELVDWIKPAMTSCETTLNSFEKIKAFYVDTHYTDDLGLVFSENNGLLTPTMKLKLKPLAMHYYPKLEELYVSLGEPTSEGQPWW